MTARSYMESLPIKQSGPRFTKSDISLRLKDILIKLDGIDYGEICNKLFDEDNSDYINKLVYNIQNKISRAAKLLEFDEIDPITDEDWMSISFLYLWATLNDIFLLRFNLKRDRWLIVDPKMNVNEIAIIKGNSFDYKLKSQLKSTGISSIEEAKIFFWKELNSKLNPDEINYGKRWNLNVIIFLKQLVGLYYTELIDVFEECRLKRNFHQLTHRLEIIDKSNENNIEYRHLKDLSDILKVLLFIRDEYSR
jgi:hypothetical protein